MEQLDRLSPHIPFNVEVLDDLFTRLESLEFVQRSHKLETEPAVAYVSALQVVVNSLMERILTRISDAQHQTTNQ